MFYTIYKTTCLVNGKFYIGKHQTKNLDDGYFGSGKLLIRAVKKHSIENFVTEIIAIYKTEHEANLAERIFVVIDSEISYNLCAGGRGGFSYINANPAIAKRINARLAANIILENKYGPNWRTIVVQLSHAKLRADKTSIYSPEVRERTKYILQKPENLAKSRLYNNTPEAIAKKKATWVRTGRGFGPKSSQWGTIWITDGFENKKIKEGQLKNWQDKGFRKGRTVKTNALKGRFA